MWKPWVAAISQLKSLQVLIGELGDLSALGTDQVIVVSSQMAVFVPNRLIIESFPLCKP